MSASRKHISDRAFLGAYFVVSIDEDTNQPRRESKFFSHTEDAERFACEVMSEYDIILHVCKVEDVKKADNILPFEDA